MQTWKPPSFDAPLPPLPEPWNVGVSRSDGLAPEPPTPAVALPSASEIQALRAKAHQEGFVRGLQDGLQDGRVQGEALGHADGFKVGLQEGQAQGFEQGLHESRQRVQELTQAWQLALESLKQLLHDLEPALTDWVYQTAIRLAGQPSMAREPFVHAVQEALMRLPHPGETLFLRIAPSDLAIWQQLQQQVSAGMDVILHEDPHLSAGHAYLEVGGTRVDVGAAARDALVRSALGLLPVV